MKLTGLTAIAMKLSVFIAIIMCLLLIPLLGMPERGESAPLMIPFFLFAVVVMVFKFALPGALRQHHAVLFKGDQAIELTNLVAVSLAIGVLWRVVLTQFAAIALQQFIYLFFAMLADFVWVELIMAALILFLQCFVSVWWLLRFPMGRYRVRPITATQSCRVTVQS
jgi:hypothetical protein